MKLLNQILRGAIIGVANIIPGVSGGTMMVSMGIYDTLIHCITHLFSDFKKSIKTLLPYAIGMLVGTWMSNFMIMDEMYAEYITLIGLAWSAMLLLIGTMVIHELPFARALGFLALTVAAMAVILFVLVLFYTLLMQLCTFGYTLYVEIVFRM